jgi:hypothetical protein
MLNLHNLVAKVQRNLQRLGIGFSSQITLPKMANLQSNYIVVLSCSYTLLY